jgi:hypothetical protein
MSASDNHAFGPQLLSNYHGEPLRAISVIHTCCTRELLSGLPIRWTVQLMNSYVPSSSANWDFLRFAVPRQSSPRESTSHGSIREVYSFFFGGEMKRQFRGPLQMTEGNLGFGLIMRDEDLRISGISRGFIRNCNQ